MELKVIGTEGARPASTVMEDSETFSVAAGQSLKVETSPGGDDILDVECPAGKAWSVDITITVREATL